MKIFLLQLRHIGTLIILSFFFNITYKYLTLVLTGLYLLLMASFSLKTCTYGAISGEGLIDGMGFSCLASNYTCAENHAELYKWYDNRTGTQIMYEPWDRDFVYIKGFNDGSTATYNSSDFSVVVSYPDGRPDKCFSYADNFYPNGDKRPVNHISVPTVYTTAAGGVPVPTAAVVNAPTELNIAYNSGVSHDYTYLTRFKSYFSKCVHYIGYLASKPFVSSYNTVQDILSQEAAKTVADPFVQASSSSPVITPIGTPLETNPILMDVPSDPAWIYIQETFLDYFNHSFNTAPSLTDFLHETAIFCIQNCPKEPSFFAYTPDDISNHSSPFCLYMSELERYASNNQFPPEIRKMCALYQLTLEYISKVNLHQEGFAFIINKDPDTMWSYETLFKSAAERYYGEEFLADLSSHFTQK